MVVHTCNNCGKEFTHKGDYVRHINRKFPCKKPINNIDLIPPNNKKKFKCQNCNKSYSRRDTLKRHLLYYCKNTVKESIIPKKEPLPLLSTTNLEINHTCKYCSKTFVKKYGLERHLKDRCKVKNNLNNTIIEMNNNNDIANTKCHEIKIIENKYKCIYCDKLFKNFDELDYHIKLYCKEDVLFNNIYELNNETFGASIFPNNKKAGEIYIISNDMSADNAYKIGVTSNINQRISQYRTGSTYEPRLYYYFPCKNIDEVDIILKDKLKKYNIKREIYKGDLDELKNIIINLLKDVNGDMHLVFKPTLGKNNICKCKHCKKLYMSKEHLLIHIEECEKCNKTIDDIVLRCDYCRKRFSNNCTLEKHIKEVCNAKIERENLCKGFVEQVRALNESVKKMNDEYGYIHNVVKSFNVDS